MTDLPLLLPDLGASRPFRFVGWLVPVRAQLIPGERIAEILVDGVDVHLEAEHSGVLVKRTAQPGDLLAAGDRIGMLRIASEN